MSAMGSCSIPGNAVIPTTQAGGISALEFFSWFFAWLRWLAMADHKDVELVLLDFGKDLSRGRRAAYHKASFAERFIPKREYARIRAE
jgi:hypothetical protein